MSLVCCEFVLNFFCRFLKMARIWESPATYIEKCSAGAMLRGVLYCDNTVCKGFDVYQVTPRKLVEVPDNQKYLNSDFGKEVYHFTFKSQEELRKFEESIATHGISLGTSLRLKGSSEAEAGAGMEWCRNTIDSTAIDNRDRRKFYSEVECTTYAAASIQFDKSDLKLSAKALEKLNKIHEKASEAERFHPIDRQNTLYGLCEEFFDDFGSHCNCGLFHLGGIHTKTSTFYGYTTSSMNKVQEATRTALKADAGVGSSMMDVKVWVRNQRAKEKTTENFDMDLLDNTKVRCHTYGGQNITTKFTEDDWITNLKQSNMDWALINRKKPEPNDLVEVWKMLPVDGFDGKTDRLQTDLAHHYTTYMYRKLIKRIMMKGECETFIQKSLCDLAKLNKDFCKIYGNKNWRDFLVHHERVAEFLLKPKDCISNIQTNALKDIADAVTQLREDFGKEGEFPKGEEIKEMLHDIDKRTEKRYFY